MKTKVISKFELKQIINQDKYKKILYFKSREIVNNLTVENLNNISFLFDENYANINVKNGEKYSIFTYITEDIYEINGTFIIYFN